MKKFIDIKENEDVEFYALVESIQQRFTPNKSSYYSASLSDGDSIIDARIWDTALVENVGIVGGSVYHFNAHTQVYAGKIQYVIRGARQIEEGEVDRNIFFRSAPITEEKLREEIACYISKIDNEILKAIVNLLISRVSTEFYTYPAAMSMHHNYASGLVYHTYTMLKLADKYLELYPGMSSDLLYAGVIVHDIGKTKELTGVQGTTYTEDGNLLGHIVIGLQMLASVASELGVDDSEEVKALSHLIASHHGELEFGSPKEPGMLEAFALHFLDITDSRLASLSPEVVKIEKGKSTGPIGSINRRSIYKPKL